VFPAGSFKVVHSKGSGTQTFNRKTCLVTVNLKGTYKIFGGTGKYAGISGSGKYQLSILAVVARSAGKCSGPFVAFQQIVKFSGPGRLCRRRPPGPGNQTVRTGGNEAAGALRPPEGALPHAAGIECRDHHVRGAKPEPAGPESPPSSRQVPLL